MRKYRITLMFNNDTSIVANVECSMSILAQQMALGVLDNNENAKWVRVDDDNNKMIITYFQK